MWGGDYLAVFICVPRETAAEQATASVAGVVRELNTAAERYGFRFSAGVTKAAIYGTSGAPAVE